MKTKNRYIIISVLILSFGVCLYVLFREPVIFTEPLTRYGIHLPVIPISSGFGSYIIKFILPDALWLVALLLYASTLKFSGLRVIAILMAPLIEIGQLLGIIEGTFDFMDLTVYIIITLIFIKQWKRKESFLLHWLNP